MRVYIPSMSRATEKNIRSGPLADIPEEIHHRVQYVVPVNQTEDYRRVLPSGVQVLACDAEGIAATRLWIGERARDCGARTFAMLDDDIRFLVRRSDDDWRLRGTSWDEAVEMLEHVEHWLGDYAHVGVSAREGNNRIGTGGLDLRNDCTRTLRFLAYRTDDFLGVEHGRVDVMEDFDVNLQLLRQGKANTSLHYWAQGQGMTNAPGGCSTYRSHEVHEASAVRLSELHPKFVRLREKKNKTDADGFGTRKEVTIQWKRAYEEGRRNDS